MLEPIFVGGIAWFWFSESWNLIQLIGGAIVIAGIYMADQARSKTA
jgi:drug/metabolite transporter (DMT)-like permease